MLSGPVRLQEESLPLEANSRECPVLDLSLVPVIQAALCVYIKLCAVLLMTLLECIQHIAPVQLPIGWMFIPYTP